MPAIWRSDLPRAVKVEATFHLTANVGYVLMVALALLVVPAVWLRSDISPWLVAAVDLPLFAVTSLSVAAFYLVAQGEARGSRRGLLRWIPFLMAVGIGLSINNCRAVVEAALGRVSPFRRTPKYALRRGESLGGRRYRQRVNRDTWIELALAIYFAVATIAVVVTGKWGAAPFLALFVVGYAYTAGLALMQAASRPGA
jgi:hypothetical protein